MAHPLQKFVTQHVSETGVKLDVRSYSGRGMYGKSCLGIGTSDRFADGWNGLIAALIRSDDLSGDERRAIADAFDGLRQDSMGPGQIYYFPNIPYVEDSEENESSENTLGSGASDCSGTRVCSTGFTCARHTV